MKRTPFAAAYAAALLPASLARTNPTIRNAGSATALTKIQRTGWKLAPMWTPRTMDYIQLRCGQGVRATRELVYIESESGRTFHGYGRLHSYGSGGLAHDGDHAIRIGWISRCAHAWRGARDRGAVAVDLRHDRRGPAGSGRWQHHAADKSLRENAR